MTIELHTLAERDSLAGTWLAELRDTSVQTDPLRFRRNIERLGEVFAMEISRTLAYTTREVNTPLGVAPCRVPSEQPVIATILRAGLPLHQGLLNAFDRADNAFISAYRKHEGDAHTFEVEIEYLASPNLDGRTVILCDPMLATGSSMVLGWKALLERGTPAHVHVVSIIASRQGVDAVREALPSNATMWMGAVDETLDERAYIVPGLGDAGDLAYGTKE